MQTFHLFTLENGLEVRLYDRTRNYYGDFHHVLLDVRCEIEIAHLTANDVLSADELSVLGAEKLFYRRTLEKMGVPSGEVDAVRLHLVDNFVRHSLPYFSTPFFAERFARAEMHKRQKRSASGMIALHA
jgi:hypothetical protein